MGRRGFWTNDGGSAHTASFTDALSSDISRFTMEAGRNRKRFPASPPGSVKSSAYCASTRHSLFTLPSLPFSLILCYVLLHRPVPEGYGRIIRRLGSGRPVVDLTSYRYTDSIFLLRMWSGRRPVKEDIHTLRKDAETGLRKRSRFGLAQKAGLFLKTVRRSRKPQMRFWFCIIVILLISEGGCRRTDYLRGLMLSSVVTDNGKPGCISVGRAKLMVDKPRFIT